MVRRDGLFCGKTVVPFKKVRRTSYPRECLAMPRALFSSEIKFPPGLCTKRGGREKENNLFAVCKNVQNGTVAFFCNSPICSLCKIRKMSRHFFAQEWLVFPPRGSMQNEVHHISPSERHQMNQFLSDEEKSPFPPCKLKYKYHILHNRGWKMKTWGLIWMT